MHHALTELRQLNIRVDAAVVEQLKVMATEQGLSLNQLTARILTAAAEQGHGGSVEHRLANVEQRLSELEQRLQQQ